MFFKRKMTSKRLYRVMTVAMLVTCVGQVSLPLASKTTEYVAKEVSDLLPETIYTKEDLLASKKDTIYKDTIENEENNRLKYEIVFNDFATSEANVKINKKSYDLNSKSYSNKTFEGETKNDIDYSIDASNVNEDVIKSLKVTKMPDEIIKMTKDSKTKDEEETNIDETATNAVTPDTGNQLIDETVTPDTGDQLIDETVTPDTGDQLIDETVTPDTGDQLIDEEDNTLDAGTRFAPGSANAPTFPTTTPDGVLTTDPDGEGTGSAVIDSTGGESVAKKGAIIANDAVVLSRIGAFDTCNDLDERESGSGTGTDSSWGHDATGIPSENEDTYLETSCELFGFNYGLARPVHWGKALPSDSSQIFDVMNVQVRDGRGTSQDVNSVVSISDGWTEYSAAKNIWTGNSVTGNDDYQQGGNDMEIIAGSADSDSNLDFSPLKDDPVQTFEFTFNYPDAGVSATSTLTVVDPFYMGSLYNNGNAIDSFHAFGNQWGEYLGRNAMLDMVLDVPYDDTSTAVDGDDKIYKNPGLPGNTDSNDEGASGENALTDEGEAGYTLGFDLDYMTNDNENPDEISGYQVNVPRGSDDIRDQVMDQDFINKYFNHFSLTVGEGADSEVDNRVDSLGDFIQHPNQGYAAKQYDNSYEQKSYSQVNSTCYHAWTRDLNAGTVYSPHWKKTTTVVSDSNCSESTTNDDDVEYSFDDALDTDPHDTGLSNIYYWGPRPSGINRTKEYLPYYGGRKYQNDGSLPLTNPQYGTYEAKAAEYSGDQKKGLFKELEAGAVYVVDDGDYDNEVPGVYNVVLGYTTETADGIDIDFANDFLDTASGGSEDNKGIADIGNQDVYMLLPVNVYEPPRIAADDTEVWQSFAPKSEADLKDAMDVEALWLKALTNEDAKDYNENHYCEEAYGPAGIGADCPNPDEDTQHYVNNMYDEVQVTSSPAYDYANPQVGSYLFTFYIDGVNGVPRDLDEGDFQREAVLYVKHDWDDIHNADLHGTTPVAVKTGTNWYDTLDKMDLALVESENGTIEYADQDITPEDITIREYGGWTSSSTSADENLGAIMVLEAVYQGLEIEGIFEVQTNWKAEPWEASDEISMSVNTPITVPVGNFDPVISPNAHAYDKNGDEVDVDVDFNRVSENIITGDHSLQVGLVGNKLIQGNYYAQNYKVVDVSVVEVEDSDMVKLAVTDANSKGSFSADNEDDFKELMDVKALNAIGEDITDNVEVYSTGDYEYGDSKRNGEPYEITFGVVDDTTGITFIDTADYYVVGNSEPVPDVTLKGTSPVYVHTGDDIDEDDIVDLLNGAIELDINNQFKDLFDEDLEIVSNDGYDPNDEDTYYVEVSGVYDEPKSDIDELEAEAIFQVIVDDNVETSSQITFEGTEDLHIDKGADFDELEGVKATSKTDGDITKDIEVKTNTVDATKDGVYEVDYYVSDSTGAYATVEREVAVGNATLEDKDEEDTDEEDTDKDNTNETNGNNKDNTNNNSDSDDDLLTQVNKDGSDELTNTATTARTLMYLVVFGMMSISYVFISRKILK